MVIRIHVDRTPIIRSSGLPAPSHPSTVPIGTRIPRTTRRTSTPPSTPRPQPRTCRPKTRSILHPCRVTPCTRPRFVTGPPHPPITTTHPHAGISALSRHHTGPTTTTIISRFSFWVSWVLEATVPSPSPTGPSTTSPSNDARTESLGSPVECASPANVTKSPASSPLPQEPPHRRAPSRFSGRSSSRPMRASSCSRPRTWSSRSAYRSTPRSRTPDPS